MRSRSKLFCCFYSGWIRDTIAEILICHTANQTKPLKYTGPQVSITEKPEFFTFITKGTPFLWYIVTFFIKIAWALAFFIFRCELLLVVHTKMCLSKTMRSASKIWTWHKNLIRLMVKSLNLIAKLDYIFMIFLRSFHLIYSISALLDWSCSDSRKITWSFWNGKINKIFSRFLIYDNCMYGVIKI